MVTENMYALAAAASSSLSGLLAALHIFGFLETFPFPLLLLAAVPPLSIFHGVAKPLARAAECLTAFVLAFLLVFGVTLYDGKYFQMGLFLSSLAIYHTTEYMFVCVFHYDSLSFDSFLINQSGYYMAAMGVSFLEYFFELWLVGTYKMVTPMVIIGVAGVCVGQFFRVGALFYGGKSFHHMIQHQQQPEHKLVTTGLYAFCRHPGYLGWYLWAVSSQVMMVNPVSAWVYVMACHIFFKSRIEYEEETLVELFGQRYISYMKDVPTRIPYIPGLSTSIFVTQPFHLRTSYAGRADTL